MIKAALKPAAKAAAGGLMCCMLLMAGGCGAAAGREDNGIPDNGKNMGTSVAAGMDKDTVNIIVATDLHYLAPGLTDKGEMFRNIVEHADGKTMMYSEELVEAFLAQAAERAPDVLVLSGDLTFNGERESHELLAQKLKRVQDDGTEVLVIPGNHDLNSGGAVRYEGDSFEYVDNLTADEFMELYGDLGYKHIIARDDASCSFVTEPAAGLRILMLDANTENKPGTVPDGTIEWMRAQLEDARVRGARVISVTHQNVLDHSSLISSGFTIKNAELITECYDEYDVICNLSGHIHMQHMSCNEDGLWDIATSSLAVSPNQYGVITVTDEGLSYHTESVDVSEWAKKMGYVDRELLDFNTYAEEFFKDICRRQVLESLEEDEESGSEDMAAEPGPDGAEGLKERESRNRAAMPEDREGTGEAEEQSTAREMADYFAGLNAAYFAGRTDLFTADDRLSELWAKQGDFLSAYIKSILDEGPNNFCELEISFVE